MCNFYVLILIVCKWSLTNTWRVSLEFFTHVSMTQHCWTINFACANKYYIDMSIVHLLWLQKTWMKWCGFYAFIHRFDVNGMLCSLFTEYLSNEWLSSFGYCSRFFVAYWSHFGRSRPSISLCFDEWRKIT